MNMKIRLNNMINSLISRIKVKNKIALLIFILVIPLVLIITVSLSIFGIRMYHNIDLNIHNSKINMVNVFNHQKEELAVYSNLISKNYIIQSNTYFNNTGILLKNLKPIMKEIKVDLIIIHNKDGIIISQAHSPDKFNINESDNEAIQLALQGKIYSTIEPYKNDIIIRNICPIYHFSNPSMIVGAVTTAYKINNKFASNLQKISGLNVIFMKDDKIFASSFLRENIESNTISSSINSKIIDGIKYDLGFININTTKLKNLGLFIAIDNFSMKNTLFWMILIMSILFVLITAIALFFSFKIGNSIVSSTQTILKYTKEIANQNYDIEIKLNTRDEFKELSDTFNQMAKNIKDSFVEIKKLKNYLTDIIESMPSMLISMDENGTITQWNTAAEKFIGIKSINAIGKNFWSIAPIFRKYEKPCNDTLKYRITKEFHRDPLKNGDTKYHNVSIFPLVANGVAGVVMRLDDVTEIEMKEKQLIQAQKLETVGTLAGGLAHDFNNVLGGIVGTLSLIRFGTKNDNCLKPEKLNDYLNTMEKASQRATDMVQQLLTLSREKELDFSPVDLNWTIKHVMKICENSFDKCIELNKIFIKGTAMIKADTTQMEQVLLNLCVNANHAMTMMRNESEHRGGKLTIALERLFADKHFCKTHPEAEEISYWSLSVRDNGVGMDTKTVAKIFDPFFTTKNKGKGSGLGLAMVYSIVKQHQGFIDVYSEVGLGTTFNIYFPEMIGVEIIKEIASTEEIPMGKGLILIIDDEPVMRKTAKEMLNTCGYDVIFAKDGEEGVQVFKEQHENIDAILLDMVMPKKSGKEAYIEMKQIDENIKIILSSGFRQDERVSSIMKLGINKFVQKPYTLSKLATAFHEVLGESV